MNKQYNYFEATGFTRELLNARLRLFELGDNDKIISQKLHDYVISPHIKQIINDFYDYVFSHKEFISFIPDQTVIANLKITQAKYLQTLGKQFDSFNYFDSRLIVGFVHQRIGMSLTLYECAYRKLREIILKYIPDELNMQTRETVSSFLSKIIGLDMSLAIDSYTQQDTLLLQNSIESLKKKKTKLKEIAERDSLTQVYNRGKIISLIGNHLKQMNENDSFYVIMIDINCLGDINSQWGHLAGDYVVKEIANRIIREDTKIKLGRYGGDQFLMLVFDVGDKEVNLILQENLDKATKKDIVLGERNIKITISQGLIKTKFKESVSSVIQRVGRDLVNKKELDELGINQ